ncbi:uncharacterized protein LOC144102380 [Amblyomma americanum]
MCKQQPRQTAQPAVPSSRGCDTDPAAVQQGWAGGPLPEKGRCRERKRGRLLDQWCLRRVGESYPATSAGFPLLPAGIGRERTGAAFFSGCGTWAGSDLTQPEIRAPVVETLRAAVSLDVVPPRQPTYGGFQRLNQLHT